MVNGKPLFTGSSEETQLDCIFQCLGTPDELTYPGVTELPEWKDTFTRYSPPEDLQHLVPNLSSSGVDLLQRMLIYDPTKRITAQEARQHDYFIDIPESLRRSGADMS